jgi:hypothetical protein
MSGRTVCEVCEFVRPCSSRIGERLVCDACREDEQTAVHRATRDLLSSALVEHAAAKTLLPTKPFDDRELSDALDGVNAALDALGALLSAAIAKAQGGAR